MQEKIFIYWSGKVKMNQAGKRHGMIKRTNKFIRNARGTSILAKSDERIIKRNFWEHNQQVISMARVKEADKTCKYKKCYQLQGSRGRQKNTFRPPRKS